MFFNKLYKVIFQSIISQNKQSRAKILAGVENHVQIQNFLNKLALKGKIQNKAADFLAKYFKSGELTDINDERIYQVVNILSRLNNFNIQTNISLDQFLKQNQTYTKRAEAKKISYLDKIPEFSQKKQYPNGVIIYRVDESRAGQLACRKIIDDNWGPEANPWCLLAGHGDSLESHYKSFWSTTYIAFPKHIAFQNGKLIGFCANSSGHCTWWNRNDRGTDKLELLDGSYMQTEKYYWTEEELKKIWLKKFNLTLNPQTGRYDCDGDIHLYNNDLIDGHFPVKFGVIKGNFHCTYSSELTSLQNGPTQVNGGFYCYGCSDLKSLEGAPKYVGGDFNCASCVSIHSLKGSPIKVGGGFNCSKCRRLISLQGAPKEVGGNFICVQCAKLVDITDAPKKRSGICFDGCYEIPNYEEYQKNRYYYVHGLTFNPKTKRYDSSGTVYIEYNDLKNHHFPIPFGVIEGDFVCHKCASLFSLENAPRIVKGNFICYGCENLKDITDLPRKVIGYIDFDYSEQVPNYKEFVLKKFIKKYKLKLNKKTDLWDSSGDVRVTDLVIIRGRFPIKFGVINGDFDCSDCKKLRHLDGAPTKVTGSINYSGCKNLNSQKQKVYAKFIQKYNLVYNPSTGRYDSNGNVEAGQDVILKGHFILPFGKINGNFNCSWNPTLKDFSNGPIEVTEVFKCDDCARLSSLEGAPKKVGGFRITSNPKLTSLEGCPQEVGDFDCAYNSNLTSLIGGPKVVSGSYDCHYLNIKSLEGCPEEVGGDFSCTYDRSLTSLIGGPKKVGGDYSCWDTYISSLVGGPEWVGGKYNCNSTRIENLIGAPKYVGGETFNCSYCDRLSSLEGISDEIKEKADYRHCSKLKESQDIAMQDWKDDFIKRYNLIFNKETGRWDQNNNEEVSLSHNLYNNELLLPLGQLKGDFYVRTKIKSFKNFPIKVEGNCNFNYIEFNDSTDFKDCPLKYVGKNFKISLSDGSIKNLTNLIGCPDYVGGDFICEYGKELISIEGLPKTIKGKTIFNCCYKLPNNVKRDSFISRENLTLNQQTGLYDAPDQERSVEIQNQDLLNGKLPVKFGNVKNFSINRWVAQNLTSLQGCPEKVPGNFNLQLDYKDNKLHSLIGGPKEVGGDCKIQRCGDDISSLIGAPKKIGGDFICSVYKSLAGFPQEIGGDIILRGQSFPKDTPRVINNNLKLYYQESWQNAPELVKGDLYLYYSHHINLKGMPKVTGTLIIKSEYISSLQGAIGKVKTIKIRRDSLSRHNRSANLKTAEINKFKDKIDIQIID